MCKCTNVKIGDCSNQIMLDVPDFMYPIRNCLGDIKPIQKICVDKCLVPIIKFLWNNKIETLNCCCGHNIFKPTIIIDEKYIPQLIKLGFSNFHHLGCGLLEVYVQILD